MEVSVTLKADADYSAPWVVFKGETVDEVGEALADFRQRGLFGSVKAAAEEFKAAPVKDAAQAVKVLQDAGTGAQELPLSMRPKCKECQKITVHKTGTNKAGRSYEGDFCPDENSKHKPANFKWTS